ncbi:MAG: hypothetical protein HY909_15905 [Deltaproteobacteria bacterium]|nr:hypothetical protein [Deltaproteobacteria bacterium]
MAKIPVRSRSRKRLLHSGAHRGARENLAALTNFNQTSVAAVIDAVYVDPAPGRAEETAELARRDGLIADAIEARAEDVLAAEEVDANVFHVDNAVALANGLAVLGERRLPSLGYLILVPPVGRMMGLRLVLPPGENERRDEARAFFRALAKVTARSGSREVFGESARGSHQLMEPFLRRSFARHTQDELARLTSGVVPEHAPIDVTYDGETSLPMLIDVRDTFGEPGAVIEAVVRRPAVPLRRGTRFLVSEVTSGGVRLHEVKRREVDGQIESRALATIDEASVLARLREPPAVALMLAERPELARENALDLLFGPLLRGLARRAADGSGGSGAALALETLRSDTFTATSPVLTSD